MLQDEVQGLACVQGKMEQWEATFVMGLGDAAGGLAEVRAHMLGQFWSSAQGIRDAGRAPLAAAGAVHHLTASDDARCAWGESRQVPGKLGIGRRGKPLEYDGARYGWG